MEYGLQFGLSVTWVEYGEPLLCSTLLQTNGRAVKYYFLAQLKYNRMDHP